MMMVRRVRPVPIIRRICQHRDQYRTDCRASQYGNHDVAVSGRGVTGHDQTTGQ